MAQEFVRYYTPTLNSSSKFVPGDRAYFATPYILEDTTKGAISIVDVFSLSDNTFQKVTIENISNSTNIKTKINEGAWSSEKNLPIGEDSRIGSMVLRRTKIVQSTNPMIMSFKVIPTINNLISIQDEENAEGDVTRYSCLFIQALKDDIALSFINLVSFGPTPGPGFVEISQPILGNSLDGFSDNTIPPEGVTFYQRISTWLELNMNDFVCFYIKRTIKEEDPLGCHKFSLELRYSVDEVPNHIHMLSGVCFKRDVKSIGYKLYGALADDIALLPTTGGELLATSTKLPFSYTPDPFTGVKYFRGRVTYTNEYGIESSNEDLDLFFVLTFNEDNDVVEVYDVSFPEVLDTVIKTNGSFVCSFSYENLPGKTIPKAVGIEYYLKGSEEKQKKARQIYKQDEEIQDGFVFNKFSQPGVIRYRPFVLINGEYVYGEYSEDISYTFTEEFIQTQANIFGNIANIPE